ncbi:hypothetical protein V4Y02_24045, partial [Escherichia coli]
DKKKKEENIESIKINGNVRKKSLTVGKQRDWRCCKSKVVRAEALLWEEEVARLGRMESS